MLYFFYNHLFLLREVPVMKITHQRLHRILGFCFLFFCLSTITLTGRAAENNYTVQLTGTDYYSKAYEMLELVNQERQALNLSPLVMDSELLTAAMQRAAECSVDFSHTRPNGSSWLSVHPEVSGENIAAGNSTAPETFKQWKNSPKHYQNMTNSSFQSIGIGCFRLANTYYWVQLFSRNTSVASSAPSVDPQVKASVQIVESVNNSYPVRFNPNRFPDHTTEYEMLCGECFLLKPVRINPGWNARYCQFDADSFTWTSSDPSVASVSPDGTVTAHRTGSANIVITPKVGSMSPVSLKILTKKSLSGATIHDIPNQKYTGSLLSPLPVIYDGSTRLQENVDYTTTFSNNQNAGTATILIQGCGDYTGSISKTFQILPIQFSENPALFSIKINGWDYSFFTSSWECLQTMVEISYNGQKLIYGKDYSFSNVSSLAANKKITSFSVQFLGNYRGSQTFSSLESGCTNTIVPQIYTGKPIIPQVLVYDSEYAKNYGYQPLKAGTDYALHFSNHTNPGLAVITITGQGTYYGSFTSTFKIIKKPAEPEIPPVPEQPDSDSSGTTETPDSSAGKPIEPERPPVPEQPDSDSSGTTETPDSSAGKPIEPERPPVPEQPDSDSSDTTETPDSSVEKPISFTAKLSKKTVVYNGKLQKPSVTVKANHKKLKSGRDYRLTYQRNRNVGIAAVKVNGIGAYKGVSKTLSFQIKPKKMNVPTLKRASRKRITLQWKKDKQATGYRIQYSLKKNFSSGVKNCFVKKNSTLKYTTKSLKKGKTYYFRIQAYKKSGKKIIYGSFSRPKAIRVR
jgi:hypothetical protein